MPQVAVPFPTTAVSQQMLHTDQQVSSIGLLLAEARQVKPQLHWHSTTHHVFSACFACTAQDLLKGQSPEGVLAADFCRAEGQTCG